MTSHSEQFAHDLLARIEDDGTSPDQRIAHLTAIRHLSPEHTEEIDRLLLGRLAQQRDSLLSVRKQVQRLSGVIETLSAPPHHVVTFMDLLETPEGPRAVVARGRERQIVTIAEQVDPSTLDKGAQVSLGNQLNVIVGVLDRGSSACGETATVERCLDGGRVVLRSRDEETVVEVAAALRGASLRGGDLVRWDRALNLALEKIERSRGEGHFLEQMPQETFEEIGGLAREIALLKGAVEFTMRHPGLAADYSVRPVGSVLLCGPPGNGKTMLARAMANFVGQISRSGRSRFMNVKPAALHSMWYGQSEANYREAFRVAREAGAQEPDVPVVLFFDEVDSVGATRGEALAGVNDRVLTAFMAELDGLETRGNVLVIAATNRPDALDPGLARGGRLGNLILPVPRPNAAAAQAILEKHMPASAPYAENGCGKDQEATRRALIAAAVSRIYSPADSQLATVTLRDNRRITVRAADLVSGALLSQIAAKAARRAAGREARTGERGIRLDDVLGITESEFDSAARLLTRANVRNHVTNLPKDSDVIGVEPIARRVGHVHQYLRVA